ncbi:type II secretion system ATPase GspE [Candidatus Protochlamydia amoebophila]|uniref:type II secretion system ATPase GspE n=1 Tax=Candidatus Protochlamydia amoebophila TaxID=362787 RepID=UPI001BCA13BD|nr:type II secretion system ATPase GspE [Candidatus Protochlamydia amoebophila]
MTGDNEETGNKEFLLKEKLGGEQAQAKLAEQFGMTCYLDLSSFRVSKERYRQVPYAFAKKHVILPVEDQGTIVVVAVADPLNLAPLEELRFFLNAEIEAVYSPRDVILSAIHDCYNTEHGAASQLIAGMGDKSEEGKEGDIEIFDLFDQSKLQSPVVQLLNLILTEAIQQGASDIHFEPSENGMRVRYRIDGVLQNRHAPSQDYQTQLLTRIKVMSKLDIAEHRLPQDGRIKLRMGRREVDFRVSTVPIAGGERIVLRILDKGNVLLGLDKIGMLPSVFEQFQKLVSLPEGIVLVTGPTGSGKTTTLYSAICDMTNDEINIMTIEDPVEYNLRGIAQIGVHHKIKLDFATGLRHILRQDPDVIMVGEIRDKETAEIAIQAALTGHLVLSTLHTNDAPSAITRLVDMGIEPYLLSSCIVGVLAQRLVRRICSDCKETYEPSPRELQSLGIRSEELKNGFVYRGKGCSSCYGTGFKGRQGVYELMPVNHAINKQIVQSPDAIEMRKVALSQGMVSLLGHGAELVKQGVSTVAEVLRVARGIEEEG